jgi:hypothetical protein
MLVSSGQSAAFLSALELFRTQFEKLITVVKKAETAPINPTSPYVPGYGIPSNEGNYTFQPVSGTFNATRVVNTIEAPIDQSINKFVSTDEIFIRVDGDARDFILDGRPNEYILFEGTTYNVIELSQPLFFLERTFYKFKLSSTT